MAKVMIAKWGNSLGFRIPTIFAQALNLEAGDVLDITEDNSMLTIRKATKKKSAKDILEDFYGMPYEKIVERGPIADDDIIDWGPDVGEEVWE